MTGFIPGAGVIVLGAEVQPSWKYRALFPTRNIPAVYTYKIYMDLFRNNAV
jgi:hypothetical protein